MPTAILSQYKNLHHLDWSGGGDERKTLRIVAKYADACNLYGSVETTKRKLDILKEHCNSLGRDYDSILKIKLSPVIIDDDKEITKKEYYRFLREWMK